MKLLILKKQFGILFLATFCLSYITGIKDLPDQKSSTKSIEKENTCTVQKTSYKKIKDQSKKYFIIQLGS
ncbi:hypothetical protein [Aquimarina sp. RZ0]|uniref:hypothetical protein n=1 Tax=Aquimarina sp. RZ0 TaxID=2607730 RepID=UPI0011F36FDF|nr:hypothetical protein [Aquimarina sp. RZ0]KAA1243375.1 hypothetical protein F0000_21455 [Aquimarina sp. RZ0]